MKQKYLFIIVCFLFIFSCKPQIVPSIDKIIDVNPTFPCQIAQVKENDTLMYSFEYDNENRLTKRIYHLDSSWIAYQYYEDSLVITEYKDSAGQYIQQYAIYILLDSNGYNRNLNYTSDGYLDYWVVGSFATVFNYLNDNCISILRTSVFATNASYEYYLDKLNYNGWNDVSEGFGLRINGKLSKNLLKSAKFFKNSAQSTGKTYYSYTFNDNGCVNQCLRTDSSSSGIKSSIQTFIYN